MSRQCYIATNNIDDSDLDYLWATEHSKGTENAKVFELTNQEALVVVGGLVVLSRSSWL